MAGAKTDVTAFKRALVAVEKTVVTTESETERDKEAARITQEYLEFVKSEEVKKESNTREFSNRLEQGVHKDIHGLREVSVEMNH